MNLNSQKLRMQISDEDVLLNYNVHLFIEWLHTNDFKELH